MYIRKPGSKTWHKLILWRPAGSEVFEFKSCNCGGEKAVKAFLNDEVEIKIRPLKDTRCKVCEFAPVSHDGPADLKRRKLWDRVEIGARRKNGSL